MSIGKNFSLTCNNPKVGLDEFHEYLSVGALYSRVQSEKGEGGTPHFQACVGYSKSTRLAKVRNYFKDQY